MTFFASPTICSLLLLVGVPASMTLSPTARASNEFPLSLEFGIGGGLLYPLTRPQLVLEGAMPIGSAQLGLMTGLSFVSLRNSFANAAESSEYSNKLTTKSASMSEVVLAMPELTVWLGQSVFLTAALSVRGSLVSAEYKTTANEPLVFKSSAIAAGLGGSAGYRVYLSPSLAFDFSTALHSQLKTTGWASADYTRDSTPAVPTLTDTELDQMLQALEPYLQTLAKQTTVATTVRLVFIF